MKKKNKKGKAKKEKRKLARKGEGMKYGGKLNPVASTLAGVERSEEKPFWKNLDN